MSTKDLRQVKTINELTTAKTYGGNDLDAASVYETLIKQALTMPGTLNKCYGLFHSYSFSNCLLAMFQMEAMGIDITPIGTRGKWKTLNKWVETGSTPIAILYPVFSSFWKTEEEKQPDGTIKHKNVKITYISGFQVHHEHFALSQTREYKPETELKSALNIDWTDVLNKLNIKQIKWDTINGNAQGYALPMSRELAINPLCATVDKTMVHEIAHILLHGNDKEFIDNDVLGRDVKEVQAEMVAYLVTSMLGVTDDTVLGHSRHYIQHWLGDGEIQPKEIKAVMRATDKILEVITGKEKKTYKRD